MGSALMFPVPGQFGALDIAVVEHDRRVIGQIEGDGVAPNEVVEAVG